MMDYAAWTDRASQFLRNLTHLPGEIKISDGIRAAPTDKHTKDWLKSKKCSLPPEVRNFVAAASTRCCFHYRWKPPNASRPLLVGIYPRQSEITGGADLCEAARFHNHDNRDWFESALGAHASVADPERERGRVAILQIQNGDQISVVCKDAEPGGEIVHVPAGDVENARVISRNFDEFLTNWERMAYVTPTLKNLKPWLDPKTGLLKPDAGKAKRLLRIFMAASAKRRSIA